MVTLTFDTPDGVVTYEDNEVYRGVYIKVGDKSYPFHRYILYNKEFFDTFGIYTVGQFFRWFVNNRKEIEDSLGNCAETFAHLIMYWTDYSVEWHVMYNRDYESYFSRKMSGQLRESVVPSVRLNRLRDFRSESQSSPFLLVQLPDQPAPEAETILEVAGFSQRMVRYNKVIQYKYLTDQYPSTPTSSVHEEWKRSLNYSYKMDPESFKFFRSMPKDSTKEPMFGIELEVSTCLSPVEIQYIVTEVEPKQEPFFIFKQDASVSGKYNPHELVTIPATPAYQKQAWRIFFSKIEMLCAAKGQKVGKYFDTARNLNNGLHIHVSKDRFYETGGHIRKFLAALNQHEKASVSFIQPFTGRPSNYATHSYCAVAKDYYEGKTIARRLKVERLRGRFAAHDRNTHTVEVRMFQGIFDIEHIIRCIEFTQAMFYYTTEASYKSVIGVGFKDGFTKFIFNQPGYRSIKKELKACV